MGVVDKFNIRKIEKGCNSDNNSANLRRGVITVADTGLTGADTPNMFI